jgi:hypothetical protein
MEDVEEMLRLKIEETNQKINDYLQQSLIGSKITTSGTTQLN